MRSKFYGFFICALLSQSIEGFSQGNSGFKVLQKIDMPGDGKWDFVTLDKSGEHLYVPHGTEMQVLNLKNQTVVATIKNTPGIHGVTLVPEVNRGFTSNGADSSVTVFHLKTFATIKKIKV